jgi:hypothetical protein
MLSGCAAIAKLECDTDWYETGRRDGRLGVSPQIDSYTARCGGNVDRARYAEGWEEGWEMRPHSTGM